MALGERGNRRLTAVKARERVLVVDDEPQVLVALEDLLGGDYVVMTSNSGEGALRLIKEHPDVAVVLSDQRMPSMSGDQLFSRLQPRSDASRVLVTGFADLSAVVRAVNEGRIFAYVNKPWDPEGLRLTVDKAAEHYRLQQELRASEERLRMVVASTGAGLFDWDVQTGAVHYSDEFAALLGEPPGALAPVFDSFSVRIHPEDVAAVTAHLDRQGGEGSSPSALDFRVRGRDGEYGWFSLSAVGVWDHNGERTRLVGAIRDVTSRKMQEQRLVSLSRVRALTSAVNASILRPSDHDALLQSACRIAVREGELAFAVAFARLEESGMYFVAADTLDDELHRGLPQELDWSVIAQEPSVMEALIAGRPLVLNDVEALSSMLQGDRLARLNCGALAFFPLSFGATLHGAYVLGARQPGYFDTAEQELLMQLASNLAFALEHQAKSRRLSFILSNDPLTGVARRELFLDRVQQRLAACTSKSPCLAVFWVDVNRFRQVNDALGRTGGDALLGELTQRIARAVGGGDNIGRLDANSFGIMSLPIPSGSDSSSLLESVASSLHAPFHINGTELRVAVAIGVALYPEDGESAELLLSRAETAGKVAKRQGQPFAFYAADMNQRVSDRLAFENKLRKAVEQQQFLLHYQPKVSVETSRVVGFEALLRWNDPDTGLVAPGAFIPVLEETGLILPVGMWVLEEAARQFSQWQQEGLEPPRIAVNVSAKQLADSSFDASLFHVLERYPSAAQGLELEITESVFMGDVTSNVEKLRSARARGLLVAIDDFGTGYSSLGYLNRLPLDTLKVDRVFVNTMDEDAQNMSLIMTIISLANSLGLNVVAEGVETPLQAKLLALLRCHHLQGFLFSKPVAAEQAVLALGQTFPVRRSRPPPAAPAGAQ